MAAKWPATAGAVFVFESVSGDLLLARFDTVGMVEDVQAVRDPVPGAGRAHVEDWRANRWMPRPSEHPLMDLVRIAERMTRSSIALTARVACDGQVSVLDQKPTTTAWLS